VHQTSMKFRLTSVTDAGDGQKAVVFDPDYGDGRNAEWAKYTPGAQLKATVLNEVAENWEPGAAYEVLIRKSDLVTE
jgi:hypothetical protein